MLLLQGLFYSKDAWGIVISICDTPWNIDKLITAKIIDNAPRLSIILLQGEWEGLGNILEDPFL